MTDYSSLLKYVNDEHVSLFNRLGNILCFQEFFTMLFEFICPYDKKKNKKKEENDKKRVAFKFVNLRKISIDQDGGMLCIIKVNKNCHASMMMEFILGIK